MFKKTLIASAIATGFIAANANAAVVAVDATTSAVKAVYSAEANIAAASYATPALDITLKADYQVGDTITITFGADLLAGETPPALTHVKDAAGTNPNPGELTFGFLSSTSNSYTYRVQSAPTAGSTVNSTLNVPSVLLDDASVEAVGTVSVTYSAKTATNVVIDAATTNTLTDIVKVVDELSSEVKTKADGVVDVTKDRLELTATTDTIQIDFKRADLSTGATNATVSKVSYTINGDFSWIIDNDPSSAATKETTVVVAEEAAGAGAAGAGEDISNLKVTDTAITFDYAPSAAAASETITVTFTPANNYLAAAAAADKKNASPIAVGSYTVDAVHTYTGGTESASGLDAGSWKLNGSTSVVQAYPISSSVTPFMWVTNTSGNAADISATFIANGKPYGPVSLGSVASNSLQYVSGDLATAFAANGLSFGRAQVTVTVNAAASNVDVTAGYISGTDRVNLPVCEEQTSGGTTFELCK